MSKITDFDGCDTLWGTQTETAEFRQDVCRYNRLKNISKLLILKGLKNIFLVQALHYLLLFSSGPPFGFTTNFL